MGFFGFIGCVVCGFVVLKILTAIFNKQGKSSKPVFSNGIRIDGYYVHRNKDENGTLYDLLIFGKNYVLPYRYNLPMSQEINEELIKISYLLNEDTTTLREALGDFMCQYANRNNQIN